MKKFLLKKVLCLTLIMSIATSLAGCDINVLKRERKSSKSFALSEKNLEKIESENREIAKKLNIIFPTKIDIHYMSYANGFQHKKDESEYIFYKKDINIENPATINIILKSLLDSKVAKFEHKESDPFEMDNILNKEMERLRKKEIKPNPSKLEMYRGYSYNDSMERLDKFDKFDSSLILSNNSNTQKIPIRFESVYTIADIDGKKLDLNNKKIENLITSSHSDYMSNDDYELAKRHKINIYSNFLRKTITLPDFTNKKKINEGSNLYWKYIDELLKSGDEFRDGIEKYIGKDVEIIGYSCTCNPSKSNYSHFNIDFSLKKIYYDTEINEYNKEIYTSGDMYILKYNNKIIGGMLNPICALDGKNLFEIKKSNAVVWIDENMYSQNIYNSPKEVVERYFEEYMDSLRKLEKISKQNLNYEEEEKLMDNIKKDTVKSLSKYMLPEIYPPKFFKGRTDEYRYFTFISGSDDKLKKLDIKKGEKNKLPNGGELFSFYLEFEKGGLNVVTVVKTKDFGYKIYNFGYWA